MSERVQCSTCAGTGVLRGLIKPSSGACFNGAIRCPSCEGSGQLGPAQVQQIAEGERRRLSRIARGVGLREEALRLGISPRALSDLEHGRV